MSQIFIFFDFQNQPVDVQLVFAEVSKHGRIVGGKAYGSWDRHKMAAFVLYNHGVELVEVPEGEFLPNKKGNDIRMAVDCVEIALRNQAIDTFFLVTGDADFTALVFKLKSYGKRVAAIARTKSTSHELITAVDLFVPYEDIVKNERLTDPLDRLCEEIENFLKRSGKECTRENITRFLTTFNISPTKYGFESLNHLVEVLYERKVDKPERLKDLKLALLKEAIFGDLRPQSLVELARRFQIDLAELKTAVNALESDGILILKGDKYEVNRSRAFFATLLEKYPVEYTRLLEFVEKTYRAFVNGRVKSLSQLSQSEFRLPASEFRTYLEACKRSGCLKGIDDSDYISYSTPAKVSCELNEFVVSTFCYFIKRVLAQTFVFKDEMQYLSELIFSNDSRLLEECLTKLLSSGELIELGGVYFYAPAY